jgi:DNA repair exonuclease SbcCD nuclease subunit
MYFAVISDMHFGVRKNSKLHLDNLVNFLDNIFFPHLERNNVKTIVNLGDLFDNRKALDSKVLEVCQKHYIDPIERGGYEHIILCGNHDAYYDNSNRVNWLRHILDPAKHTIVDTHCHTQDIVGHSCLFVPWIAPDDRASMIKSIEISQAKYCFGHFEIAGGMFNRNRKADHGDDPYIFEKFNQTFSGHFHKKHAVAGHSKILYVGSPYEMTWDDEGLPKGAWTFKLTGMNLGSQYINNNRKIYEKHEYYGASPNIPVEYWRGKHLNFIIPSKELEADFEKRMVPVLRTIAYESLTVDTLADISEKSGGISENQSTSSDSTDMQAYFSEYLDGIEIAAPQKKAVYADMLNDLYRRAKL